jgi:hypothetical protein
MLLEFIKTFEKAEPFIYVLKGDLYYIGVAVCRKCQGDEKHLYREFFNKYIEIKKTPYPSKKNISQLVELYEKIVNCPKNIIYDEYSEALKEMAFGLNENEIYDILDQRNIVTDIYNYKREL